ncbi:MAG: thiopurine S-methyltransferase [Balneolaceae bacterium]|nr:MAG: thiopurine S-methyltransferase [Balneolaceae bacterium]
MELSYWQSRWENGKTGFHMQGGYPGLRTHWNRLPLPQGPHVFVPLCGKTEDMIWLSSQAARVTGVEISHKAVMEFFHENGIEPQMSSFAGFTIYKSQNIEIWCGDFQKFPVHKINPVDLIYDKAALVALPERMRADYCRKIKEFCRLNTAILLHHFDYDQKEMPGPPFSISTREVQNLFGSGCAITQLEKNSLDIAQFQKFTKRGLKSYLIEYLLLLLCDGKK